MRVIWKALIVGAFVIATVAISQTTSRSGPVFTKDGDLVLPTGFREWVFMGGLITPNSLVKLRFQNSMMSTSSGRIFSSTRNTATFPKGLSLSRSLYLPKREVTRTAHSSRPLVE